MAKIEDLTDDELIAEQARRNAAKQDAENAAFIAAVQPIVDAGWGKPEGEHLIKALEENYLDLPRGGLSGEVVGPDLRIHAEAMMRIGRLMQDALASRLRPAVGVVAVAPAQP